MKNIILILGLCFVCENVIGQKNEFPVYANGLIYSEVAMEKLGFIVDSLNLKFKTCEANPKFYSISQTVGNKIYLKDGNVQQAKKDIENNIPFEEFVKKYPNAEITHNRLISRNKYKNYENKEVAEFSELELLNGYGSSIELKDLTFYDKDLQSKWVYYFQKKSKYYDEYIVAFYFPNSFVSNEIPQKYAKMIGYADCLIDTTTSKIKKDAEYGWVTLPENWISMSKKEKEKLLEEMRSTQVMGQCSQDNSPRYHALNIALLSAETFNWSVFLKAHLDIMNDRFERVTDGSYAWAARNTYIRELESLDINVLDLILGISFQYSNAANNHYFGSIGRVGRALSETKNRNEIEMAILNAIADNQLDDYNRIVFYFLFSNYNYFISDEAIQKANKDKLLAAINNMPSYFKNELIRGIQNDDE